MKELSIEEKAKAYDRVREKIALRFGTDVAEGIFSEFEESEDERIRKALLEMVHDTTGDELWVDYNVHKEDALAWLEKQGEVESDNDDIEVEEKGIREAFNKIEDEKQCKQKPQRMISAEAKEAMYAKSADIVEPKFKEGEWLCENEPNNYARFIQILEIVNVQGKDRYRISRDIHKDEDVVEFGFVEKYYHKFDIQDAKDGDVLAAHECFVLFKKLDGLNIRCYCTYHYMNNPSFHVDTLQNKNAFHPATKEQRDTLMKAMTNAGYTFDFEKKELKLLITNGGDFESENCEQKPVDTVEQKCEESKTKIFDAPTPFEDKLYVFVAACEFLAIPSKIEFILEHSQEILDAAREQIGKEQSSTWSKEDEKEYKYVLKFVDNILNNCGNKKDYEHCKRCYDWLKSLKTKVQPKQEWSEKDEEELEIAIDTLKESGRYDSAKWVQSLKQRIGG